MPPLFMRTTLDLPEELVRLAKIVAVQRRSTLRELVAAGLRRELSIASQPHPVPAALPAIRLPADAPILQMTPAALSAVLHAEQALDDATRAG